jgi:hypothetical protein
MAMKIEDMPLLLLACLQRKGKRLANRLKGAAGLFLVRFRVMAVIILD